MSAHVQVDIRAALGTGFAATTRKASQHLTVFKGAAEQISAQQKILSARISETNRQMQGMRSQAMGQAIGLAAVGYGAAKAIAPAIGFEQAMVDVLAISTEAGKPLSKTSQAFGDLTRVAKHLGATTEHSAIQVAEGMKYMTMAGFDAQETIAGIGSVMALSTVGDLGAARASDIASNILGAFKLPATEMHQVADVMSQVITTANVDVEMLGETMKYMGPIAHKFGLSLSESAAAAGLLGNIGIQGSMAGTAMRQLMTRMAAPPKEAQKALEALSVSTMDAQGNMRAFQGIMADVAAATEQLGSAGQLEMFKKIFGQIAMTGGAELVSLANSGELQAYFDEVANNYEGAAKRIQATKLDTASGDLTLLVSAISGAAVAIGDTLLPSLRSGVQYLTAMFSHVAELATAYPGLTQAIMLTVTGLIALRGAMLAGRVASLLFGTSLLRSRIALLAFSKAGLVGGTALRGFAAISKTAFLGAAAGLKTLSAALLANPIGLAIAGIAYGASLIIRNWESVSAFFQNLWAAVGQTFSGAAQTIKALLSGDLSGAFEGLKATWDGLQQYYQLLWQGVKATFQAVVGDISAVLAPFVPDGLKAAWSGVKTFFADIWQGLVPQLPDLSTVASSLVGSLSTGIIQPIKTSWTAFKSWLASFWPGLFAGFSFDGLKSKVSAGFGGLFEGLAPKLDLGFIDELGSKAITRIKQAWQGFSFLKLLGLESFKLPKLDLAALAPFNLKWPKFEWPAFTWPAFNWPSFVWPLFTWPSFAWPAFNWPVFEWPSFSWPQFVWPQFVWPQFVWPEIRLPAIKPPKFDLPELALPELKVPELKLPEIAWPELKLPAFEGTGLKAWATSVSTQLETGLNSIKTKLKSLKSYLLGSLPKLFDGIALPSLDLKGVAGQALESFTAPFAGLTTKLKTLLPSSLFPDNLFTGWISGNQKSADALAAHTDKLAAFSGSADQAVAKLEKLGAVERNRIAFDAKNQLVEADAALAQNLQSLRNTAKRGWGSDNKAALGWIKELEAGKSSVAEFQSALEAQAQSSEAWLASNAEKLYEQAFALDEAKKKAEALKATLENVAAANQKAASQSALASTATSGPQSKGPTPATNGPKTPAAPLVDAANAEVALAKIQAVNQAAAALPQTVQTAITSATSNLSTLDWSSHGSRLMASLIAGLTNGALGLQTAITTPLSSATARLAGMTWFAHGAKLMDTLIAGLRSKSAELKSTVSAAFAETRKLMPSSDAKEGPFSSLTASGRALVTTFGSGIAKAGVKPLKAPLQHLMAEGAQRLKDPLQGYMDLIPHPIRPVQIGDTASGDGRPDAKVRRALPETSAAGSVSIQFGAIASGQVGAQSGSASPVSNNRALNLAPNITVNVNLASNSEGADNTQRVADARLDASLIAEHVRDVMAQMMDEAAFDNRSAFTDGI